MKSKSKILTRKTLICLISMNLTYIIFTVIRKGSFASIEWDIMLVMSLSFLASSMFINYIDS
ncbi:hypothetical protein [Clostridium paridis]|uniref:hypothetical protein n=1 Tax=Clostridium paridis TaxID=2803863 RepID=UPI00192ACCE2|nr:hypothetical protein [Clostridium paridis]